jgi:hypothetical protein
LLFPPKNSKIWLLLFCRRTISANDLRASEGRETKALNCKPNTNLKEISELSNYCKTSGFRLHAVSASGSRPGSQSRLNYNSHNCVRSPSGRALNVRIIVNVNCQKVKANKLDFVFK